MFLRSACDWHLDPFNEATILNYLDTLNLKPADVEPLSLDFYLTYTEWLQQQKGISPLPARITKIDQIEYRFSLSFDDGQSIVAQKVVQAKPHQMERYIPEPYISVFPQDKVHHTAEHECHSVFDTL